MDRSVWFAIILLAIVAIGGGIWEQMPSGTGGLTFDPGQPQRRGEAREPVAGIEAEAFVRQVPAPPSPRLRTQLVIERDGQPRRGGTFIGTAWALTGTDSWMSARHVTEGCRRLSFLGTNSLPAATGHPRADISAIALGGPRHGNALELSLDPLTSGEDVYLVGFPSGEAATVFGTVTGTGILDHRGLGHRETIVVVAQRKRVPSGSAELGGISGGPVLDADGNVVGTVIGGSARRARSIISIERNVAWLAASAGSATAESLGGAQPPMALTPANFARATAPLLANGPVRLVRCDR